MVLESFADVQNKREEIKLKTLLDETEYHEYIAVCDGFLSELNELNKSIEDGNSDDELTAFYENCSMEQAEIDQFIEDYRKEVGEKYSAFVIDHLDDEDEEKRTCTDQIVRLTPDLVSNLLVKVSGETALDLNGLEVLDEDSAAELVKFEGDELYLNKLEDLDPDTSLVLAGFSGKVLSLNGIKEFNEGIENLKIFSGEKLSLEGIDILTEEDVDKIKEFGAEKISLGEITDTEIIALLSEIDEGRVEFIEKQHEETEIESETETIEETETETETESETETVEETETGTETESETETVEETETETEIESETETSEETETSTETLTESETETETETSTETPTETPTPHSEGDQSKFEKIRNNITNWFNKQWEKFKNKEWVKSIRTKINEKLEGKSIWDFIIDRIFK